MNVSIRRLPNNLRKIYHRRVHVETKQKQAQWLKPVGYETNLTIYNPVIKCKVPLILRNKNILTWYVCGPTVYDSAHIGHATTYVKSDIIRRILSDHFNINIVMAMCITDIDDKIIARSKAAKQNCKDLTQHYENEFFEDMETLNVVKPHLYCRVTDYVPQIIEFVKNIVDKGNAYLAEDVLETVNTFRAYLIDLGTRSPVPLESIDLARKRSPVEREGPLDSLNLHHRGAPNDGTKLFRQFLRLNTERVKENRNDVITVMDISFCIQNRRITVIEPKRSVYFDTSKYNTYGKLSPPVVHENQRSDPRKKSVTDFSLWKAAKDGEPFWDSPWGRGRPGWHIECSTIASTVFGNSLDIHSGGIDLAFPHHENEEAQSCSYHEVDQWVNYWLHCGHLFLEDVKMSKSLSNTISIREFLNKYSANQFRTLCLLSNYRTGIKFSDEVVTIAVNTLNKIEHFVSDCDNYIAGRWNIGSVDEVALLRCLAETQTNVDAALADDFNTGQAMRFLVNLIDTGNKMLHEPRKTMNTSVPAVAAVSNYVSTMLSKFGVSNSATADERKINTVIDHFVQFRNNVRNRVLENKVKDKMLLAACDEARVNLSALGVTIKDAKDVSSWSIKKY